MSVAKAAPLFARSLAFVDGWLAELAKPVAAKAAPAAAVTAAPIATAAPVAAAAPAASAPKVEAPKADAPALSREEQKKAKAAAKAKGAAPKVEEGPERTSMSRVAFLCGTVTKVEEHPASEKLWVEQIDLGEEQPRTVLSGLRAHITAEEFLGRRVVVVANLDARKMGGIASAGMVLCGSLDGKVRLLEVPEGVPNGERITFPGHDGPAEPVLKKKLAKHYDEVAPLLKTNDACVAAYGDLTFVTTKGPVVCTGMPDASVS